MLFSLNLCFRGKNLTKYMYEAWISVNSVMYHPAGVVSSLSMGIKIICILYGFPCKTEFSHHKYLKCTIALFCSLA